MRALALAALSLVGCYRPNGEAACTIQCTSSAGCPSHLECRNGFCTEPNIDCTTGDGGVIDGGHDGATDGPPGSVCNPTQSNEIPIASGESFYAGGTADRYAAKYAIEMPGTEPLGIVRGTRGDVTMNPTYDVRLVDDMVFLYREPRVAANGLEIYVRMEPAMTGTTKIGMIARTTGTDTWSAMPAQLTITNVVIGANAEPSPPTLTTPRRMLINTGIGSFAEVQQIGQTSWNLVRTQAFNSVMTDDMNLVMYLGQAHMTSDGLKLVFRGQVAASTVGAYYMQRATLADVFGPPAHHLPTLGSVSHPFLLADCSALFYDRVSEGQIYQVVYPQ